MQEVSASQGEPRVAPPPSQCDAGAIEEKWQRAWSEEDAFATPIPDQRPCSYVSPPLIATGKGATLGQLRAIAIADAEARFRRACGDAVLFAPGFDGLGSNVAREAAQHGLSPQDWATRCRTQISGELERLGFSFDWQRSFDTADPSSYRWGQWLLLQLLQKGDGLVIENHPEDKPAEERSWAIDLSTALSQAHDSDRAPAGWTAAAAAAQSRAEGRVDGIEIEATILGVGQLPVFGPDVAAIGEAAFVAVSPSHPGVEAFASEPETSKRLGQLREQTARRSASKQPTAINTGLQASVPGAPGLLPIVITGAVDPRYGASAVLGIPERDPIDRALADQLPSQGGGLTMKLTTSSHAEPKPAMRVRGRSRPLSKRWGWGAPVPSVICPSCGSVPAPPEWLPVELEDLRLGEDGKPLPPSPAFSECECPSCRGPAQRATSVIHPRFTALWAWLIALIPPDQRFERELGSEVGRWLPARGAVAATEDGDLVLDQRLAARLLARWGELQPLEGGEPFRRLCMCGGIRSDGAENGGAAEPKASDLLAQVGADCLRLALLGAAAPETSLRWTEQPIRRSQRFLLVLWDYAAPRLREWQAAGSTEIETSEKLRRRLLTWVRVAVDKVTTELERMRPDRAIRNVELLLARIEDFEARTLAQKGKLSEQDRSGIGIALLTLLRLLAPCAPHISEELWQLSGQAEPLRKSPWPNAKDFTNQHASVAQLVPVREVDGDQ